MPLKDILSREKDLGETAYSHEVLAKGSDFEACKTHVLQFFQRYELVRYSQINISATGSLSAASSEFEARLQNAISQNRQRVRSFIKELQEEKVYTVEDLEYIPQGYKSKMLHVITHFLDGFFGIDTYFYNLPENSHWVTEEFRKKIYSAPLQYWLLFMEARI